MMMVERYNSIMKTRYVLLIIFTLLLLLSSCAATKTEIKQIPPLVFDKSSEYKVDLTQIDRPKPIQPQYGRLNPNGTITIIPREQLENKDLIILNLDEYKKVESLIQLCITYKTIILQQEVLINEKIKIENSVKELAELERIKANEYYQLFQESENSYKNEIKERRNDNLVNKVIQGIMTGAIIVLAL